MQLSEILIIGELEPQTPPFLMQLITDDDRPRPQQLFLLFLLGGERHDGEGGWVISATNQNASATQRNLIVIIYHPDSDIATFSLRRNELQLCHTSHDGSLLNKGQDTWCFLHGVKHASEYIPGGV